MEMHTKENERLIKTLQLEARKEAAVSRYRSIILLRFCAAPLYLDLL